jgi:hypothetical protein
MTKIRLPQIQLNEKNVYNTERQPTFWMKCHHTYCLLRGSFLLGLAFNTEDGSKMFLWNTMIQSYIPEDGILHGHYCKNIKSYILNINTKIKFTLNIYFYILKTQCQFVGKLSAYLPWENCLLPTGKRKNSINIDAYLQFL